MSNILKFTDGSAGVPAEPEWDQFYNNPDRVMGAHKYWLSIVSEMKTNNTICNDNFHAILRLVSMRLEYDEAMIDVALRGRLAAKAGTRSPFNPNWAFMKQAAAIIKELEAELGLSPRRRESAGKVKRGEKQDNKASSNYLKP